MLKNLMTRLGKSAIRIAFMVYIAFVMLILWEAFFYQIYNSALMDSNLINKVKRHVDPMKSIDGGKYCSSSTVRYKGQSYTVTNRHCCQAGLGETQDGYLRVGNRLEKKLYEDKLADICILTSSKEEGLKLAISEAATLEKVLLMGYPRGTHLTPRFGHVVAKYKEICLFYDDVGLRCMPSHIISSVSYGGNSGSAVVNDKGELVGVLFAGSRVVHTFGIIVPLVFVRRALEHTHTKVPYATVQ